MRRRALHLGGHGIGCQVALDPAHLPSAGLALQQVPARRGHLFLRPSSTGPPWFEAAGRDDEDPSLTDATCRPTNGASWRVARLPPARGVRAASARNQTPDDFDAERMRGRDERGIEVRFIPVTDDFRLDLSNLDELLKGVKLVSVTAMSNVLGTINPVKELSQLAHQHGALIAIDGAQSIAHGPTDVLDLDIDFLAFSGHKMLGPTGIGVFWTRAALLDAMPPFLGGGGMIADVRLDGYTPADGPTRFEAGTPPIAEAAGLGAAVRYLEGLGMDNIDRHGEALTADALSRLQDQFAGRVRIIGPAEVINRGPVISLDVEGVHAHDVAQVLDQFGVCVRPGHHCAKPLMRRFGLVATVRASYGPYSLVQDTDVLLEALEHAIKMFG